jgi:hypothetical protein
MSQGDILMIEDFQRKAEIKRILRGLGNMPMRKGSHNFKKYGGMSIAAASEAQLRDSPNMAGTNAAISLLMVVLAANRKFETQVHPHIERIRDLFPKLTFKDLRQFQARLDYEQFASLWGHKDKDKYETLAALLRAIAILEKSNPRASDMAVMKRWARKARFQSRETDIIGRLPRIGVATFQHLRMVYGVDTVKPDVRVKQVLAREFKAKLTPDEKVIQAVEEIASITKKRVILIDQIFVKYGSGYY